MNEETVHWVRVIRWAVAQPNTKWALKSATCVMNFDGAKGWLVGELNKGLACMFTMMNYERLVWAFRVWQPGERSYQNAVEYARDRIQGRAATGPVAKTRRLTLSSCILTCVRLLMTIRAMNEGSRAFSTYVASFDMAKYADDSATRTNAEALAVLLTPVAKAFLTDRGFDSTVFGQQVLWTRLHP